MSATVQLEAGIRHSFVLVHGDLLERRPDFLADIERGTRPKRP
jgi:hypothetical protein